MKRYGGIALPAHNRVVVWLKEQAQVGYQKRVSNQLEQILHQLAP